MKKYLSMIIPVPLLFAFMFAGNSNDPNHPAEPAEPVATATVAAPAPHCEVPCGIYADQRRFEEMLEDTATIAKAIDKIVEAGEPTPTQLNQKVRWINNKEIHATNIQHIASQYFLTQRIKADKERYEEQLKAAHSVIVSAMKCKQDANPETAKTLKVSIGQLYRAYEGKDPAFEEGH